MRKRIFILTMCLGLAVSSMSACKPMGHVQETAGKKQQVEKVSQETADAQQKKDDKKEEWIENPIPEEAKVQEVKAVDKLERQMYINAMKPIEPLNLTAEQKLEDFDFFWNMMQEKIFCLDELAESRGVNLEKHIADYRDRAANSKDDVEFYNVLQQSTGIFYKVWHMGLGKPYAMLDVVVRETLSSEESGKYYTLHYKDAFNEENAGKLKYWDVLLTQNIYQYKEEKNRGESVSSPMPELKLLNDKVAVITLPTMMYWPYLEEVGDLLETYMKEVSDFEHVIIDLKSNGGGQVMFAVEKIIAPNIEKPVTYSELIYFKNTDDIKNVRQSLNPEIGEKQENYIKYTIYQDMPLTELPDEMKIADGEYGNADFFGREDVTILPKYNKKILNGKVWVLTYQDNYSAAEEFTMACKDTGFATLVGKQTAGDGGSGGIHYFALPNSGLIGQVSYSWRLNEDGTVNANEGTKPDIESPEGEIPLETCLRAIEEYEKNK